MFIATWSRHIAGLTVFFLFFIPFASAQRTIRIPADQPTIQAGINATQNGDIVLVAPGTYFEKLDFNGKAITVTSSDGAQSTTIDGSHIAGFMINFAHGETRNSILSGFSITHSCSDFWPVWDPMVYCGAIYAYSSPSIRNNIIQNNYGYGIKVGGLNGGGPLIQNNTISYTMTQYDPRYDFGCDYSDGRGISIEQIDNSSLTDVIGNVIEHNAGHASDGGGIYVRGLANIVNNTIRYNKAECEGGGIYNYDYRTRLVGNLIYGNVARVKGGGLFAQAGVTLVNNTFWANTLDPNLYLFRDYYDGSQVGLSGCNSYTPVYNNIIVGTDQYAAFVCEYLAIEKPSFVMDHNLFQNSMGPTYRRAGSIYALVSSTEDPTTWETNISADPKFADPVGGNFTLQSGSPAIDAGNNSAPLIPLTDLAGQPRIQRAGNGSYAVIDLGAYEIQSASALEQTHTALIASSSHFHYGDVVTLRASVTATTPVTDGSVGFFDGNVFLGTAPVNDQGIATLVTNAILAGIRPATASFAGTPTQAPSTSTVVSVTVDGIPTTLTLDASSLDPTYDQGVVMTATASSSAGTPTGTVVLYWSGSSVAIATASLQDGKAVFAFPAWPRDKNGVIAGYAVFSAYAVQDRFAASKSNGVVVNYQAFPTRLTFSSFPNPLPAGKPFNVTIGLRRLDGQLPTLPTGASLGGIVYVYDRTISIAFQLMSLTGDVIVTLPALAQGQHVLSATYTPWVPSAYAASTSAPLNVLADIVLQLTRPSRPTRANGSATTGFKGSVQRVTMRSPILELTAAIKPVPVLFVNLANADAATSEIVHEKETRTKSKHRRRRASNHSSRGRKRE